MSDSSLSGSAPERLWNRRERDGKREVCRVEHGHLSDDCQWEVLNGLRVPAWFTYDATSPIGGHIEIAAPSVSPSVAPATSSLSLDDLLDDLEQAIDEERVSPTGSRRGIDNIRAEILHRFDPRSPSSPAPSSETQQMPDIESTFGVGDYANSEISGSSRGSEEELGKLLDTTMKAFWEESGAPMCPLEMPNYRAARSAVESYVSRLRDERDALQKISENYEMLSRGINENSGECSPSCNSYGHDEHCEYVDDAATIRIQQERLEALRAALQGTDTELSQVCAELASLKEQQLTPEEAQKFLWLIDNSSGNEDPDIEPLRAKLRLLSTSDSEQITFNRGFVG